MTLGACAGPDDYECTVTWTVNGEDTTAEFSYDALDSAQDAVDQCMADQADHEDRPPSGSGISYDCDCESL